MLIPAGLFKVKLTSEEIVIKARPAKSQIDKLWGFNFDEKPALVLNILVL